MIYPRNYVARADQFQISDLIWHAQSHACLVRDFQPNRNEVMLLQAQCARTGPVGASCAIVIRGRMSTVLFSFMDYSSCVFISECLKNMQILDNLKNCLSAG